jgi:acyl carrier protein
MIQSPKTYNDIRQIALDFIQTELERNGLTAENLDDETDLLATGIIDSFGFLDLISEIEDCTGLPLDLGGLDPDSLLSLRGLIEKFMAGSSSV